MAEGHDTSLTEGGRGFRACGRGGRIPTPVASVTGVGMTWQEAGANNPSGVVEGHDTSLTEGGKGIPRLRARRMDSHASDVGHWLGMT